MYGYNFPNNYTQNYAQPQDGRIWVQNETSAEAYLLAPNGFARLWDSSQNKFYEKRADATGRPLPMDVYEYTRVSPQIEQKEDNTVKISFEDINAKIDAINARIDALETNKKGVAKNVKQSNADDTSI